MDDTGTMVKLWEDSAAASKEMSVDKLFVGRGPEVGLSGKKFSLPFGIIVARDAVVEFRTTTDIAEADRIQFTAAAETLAEAKRIRDAAADLYEDAELPNGLYLQRERKGWLAAPDGVYEAFVVFEFMSIGTRP